MKDFCERALDTAVARGAGYADIRIIHAKTQNITTRNGEIAMLDQADTLGFGVRVIVDGAWGFASSARVTFEEIDRIAALAVQIGKASATLKKDDVRLAAEPAVVDFWQTPLSLIRSPCPLTRSSAFSMRSMEY